ncbi:helix-turn-helix transcriptional regulator [Paenacidovorax caeni]
MVLRQARHDAGLTQADLALRSGLTSRYIRSLEAGKACPSLDAVFRLAQALEKEVHDFVMKVKQTTDLVPADEIDFSPPRNRE